MYQGIRYIDLVKPLANDSLSNYLPEGMLMRQINGIAGKQIDGFSGASFDTEAGKLAVRCWMNPSQAFPPDLIPLLSAIEYSPEKIDHEFAILDTDHSSFANGAPFNIDVILNCFDAMHRMCHKAFKGIASEYAIRIWQDNN